MELLEKTSIDRLQVRMDRLEGLIYSTMRSVESNSVHIGRLKDGIDTNTAKIDSVKEELIKDIGKVKVDTQEKIKEFENKIAGNVVRLNTLEKSLEGRINALTVSLTDKQDKAISRLDNAIKVLSDRHTSQKQVISAHQERVAKEQGQFVSDIGTRIKKVEYSVNIEYDKKMQTQIKEFKHAYATNLNTVNSGVVALKKDIAELRQIQRSLKKSADKTVDNIYNIVNERLNNFINDINKKLVVKSGSPKDVLKRIAYLEGIKDASTQRKSTKEVLEELYNTQINLLKSESKGTIDKEALNRVNTLTWVLGRE